MKTIHQIEIDFSGYSAYPKPEDVDKQGNEEKDTNPEAQLKMKTANELAETQHIFNSDTDFSGKDLEVPGAELDNPLEDIQSEDEENYNSSLLQDVRSNLDANQTK